MRRRIKKTHAHIRFVDGAVRARASLREAVNLLDAFRNDEGELLSESDLRDKAVRASTWLGDVQAQVAILAQCLEREIEYRENEADPEMIRHRKFQAELREMQKQPKRRRKAEELKPDVLRLRDEGLIPAAIADALQVPDSAVKKILKEAV